MATRKSRSKAELSEAMSEVSRSAKKEPVSPKEAEARQEADEAIRDATESIRVEDALQSLAGTGAKISHGIATISGEVTKQIQALESIRAAVNLERAELERLHGVDVVASAIDVLVAEHAAKRKDLDQEINDLRFEHEKIKEQLAQERAEEEDTYTYELGRTRRTTEDEFAEEMKAKHREANLKTEELAKGWREREEELKKRETELIELRKQVTDFPALLDKEKKAAEAIVGNSIKRDYEHRIALLVKDADSVRAIAEMRIRALDEQVTKLALELTNTHARLAETDKKVQSIAEKALDAASGRQALAEVQSLAGRENSSNSRSKA